MPARLSLLLSLLTGTAAAAMLAGCAWIITGTSQTVQVESSPTGAECRLVRDGIILRQFTAPAEVTVQRRKDDLTVRCEKEGAGSGSASLTSGVEAWVYGNAVAGGLIGWGVDSAVGADNAYPDQVVVVLGARSGSAPENYGSVPTTPAAIPSPAPNAAPSASPAPWPDTQPSGQAYTTRPEPQPAAPAPAADRYGVHLGAYGSLPQAQQAWGFYRSLSDGLVTDSNAFVTQRPIGGGTAFDLYAARLSRDRAVDLCAHLLDQQQNCQVVYY